MPHATCDLKAHFWDLAHSTLLKHLEILRLFRKSRYISKRQNTFAFNHLYHTRKTFYSYFFILERNLSFFPDVEETLDDIIKAAEDEDEDDYPAHDLFDNYPESDDEDDTVNFTKHTLVYLNSEGSSYPSNFPNFENKSVLTKPWFE